MAQPSKSRATRRSSSSTSYASTLTTLLFIALCVLGIWMLASNSVVSPNTRTAIDNNSATTNNDFSSAEDTTTTETAATTTNISDDSTETAKNTIEESPETITKSQDQKDATIYGDNPGNLPDDAIKSDDRIKQESNSHVPEENASTKKQELSATIEAAGSDNDQKINEFEKEEQTTQVSEVNQKVEEENTTPQDETPNTNANANVNANAISEQNTESQDGNANVNVDAISEQKTESQDANANVNVNAISEQNTESQDANANVNANAISEQNTESQDANANVNANAISEQNMESQDANANVNVNANANWEQSTESQDANAGEIQEERVGSEQGSKNSDDEANQQQLREDKGEVTEKDQKQKLEGENEETEKKRRKKESKKSWSTQADESRGEKERQKEESKVEMQNLKWSLCNVTVGADYIPCLDNEKYLKTSHRKHFEHRERHCPEDAPTCLVPLPHGYKTPIQWPSSRDKIWYHNIPHTLLAEVKGHQNWVKKKGEFLTFPGGGTQFIHGALHYIDFLEQAAPDIAWGKHTRVILDVGCGVGSFGGYLFEKDVIAMSFAPKDEHEAQVQFALERGIPAISAVMGTQRLQFPSGVFDLIHCARCRVPWHEDGGLLLLELNRLLRPGGYFVWCATPVYQRIEEDAKIWKQMTLLTKSICWELVTVKEDALNQVGAAFYRKPANNKCYEQREKTQPPMCKDDDDPNAAWYVPLQGCMHKLHVDRTERGTRWPEPWPRRLRKAPYWLNNLQAGKQASEDFVADNERWQNVVDELCNIGITWSNVRNVMDMRTTYGGFAAALKDLPVWVFNVVNIDSPDTLSVIYERGLIGIYHDWCESFSTYPRTYDLLHADHLFSILKHRCNLVPVIAEVDRILRPGGNLVVRDESSTIREVENLLTSLHWEITSKNQEGLLCARKGMWRPNS